jgi:signal transduction histidine kinase
MLPRRWVQASLARKISWLFGTAVLLVIAVTLVFPWLHMTALNEQTMLLQAQRIASVARQVVDLRQPDWSAAQKELDHRWSLLAQDMGLPQERPRLIPDGPAVGPGFQRDAVERLRDNPRQRYYWTPQKEGRIFRFAMAVRSDVADRHPDKLLGIIDVRLPVRHEGTVWNSVVTALAGATGAVLAILVFYMVIQRLVLSPVHTLRRVAEKVTSGDIAVRSAIDSRDEFEDLSEAMNDMLTHLKSAQDEQYKINRSLDIRLGELAETNVALYESNRMKSEFLANVTHELRTPLVSIIGFAELLRDAWDGPEPDRERLRRYSENILTSGRNLLDIINDLLDLAKIEAGKLQLHLADFSMAELCTDLIDFVRPLADKRNQELELQLSHALPPCHGDTGKIKQILYNLLSNAIKFTPTGGSISLTVVPASDDRIKLIVQDTGPGIAPEKRDVIFEKFQQLDGSQTREHEGTGLGLAITRDLAQMLGGSIGCESVVGRGSTFTVELPARVTEGAASPALRLT